MNSIDQIIDACGRCINFKTTHSCYGCAYEQEDKCYDKLREDVIFQLRRLKRLEKEGQPELPGLEDPRERIINIRMNEEEYQHLCELREKMDMSNSEVIRKAIEVLVFFIIL